MKAFSLPLAAGLLALAFNASAQDYATHHANDSAPAASGSAAASAESAPASTPEKKKKKNPAKGSAHYHPRDAK